MTFEMPIAHCTDYQQGPGRGGLGGLKIPQEGCCRYWAAIVPSLGSTHSCPWLVQDARNDRCMYTKAVTPAVNVNTTQHQQ